MPKEHPTQSRLKELFFDEDGKLFRLQNKGCAIEGDTVGTLNRYHLYVYVDGKRFRLDECVWIYFNGTPPKTALLHLDNNPENCFLENLKEIEETPKSGIRGISWNSATNQWQACIFVLNVKKYVGRYDTIPECLEAMKAKAEHIRKEYAELGFKINIKV